jgi:saccharopine dehydrogenase-like NADP-dependent oxidoreductase
MTNKVQNKTIATKVHWKVFLEKSILTEEQRNQAEILVDLFEKVTGSKCVMWGEIFGFGTYYVYDNNKNETEWMATSFAIRKAGIMIYITMGCEKYIDLIKVLGKCKITGKSCLNIKDLKNVDLKVLEKLVKLSLEDLNKKYKITK